MVLDSDLRLSMRGKSKGINQGEQGGTQLPDCMIPHRRFGVEEFFLRAMK
ncbi:MAG: hypothetical protein UF030_01635 [Eggerthellaceae bacterium]|nr:hypothetical protein [Eggerthellaceae bacterium]